MKDLAKYLPGTCSALPSLGQDFADLAKYHNVAEDVLIGNLLFNAGVPQVPLTVVAGVKQQFDWVSGHTIADRSPAGRGPRKKHTVAIVGKCLGVAETRARYLFAGKTGELLRRFLEGAGLAEYKDIYLTNLIKTTPLRAGKWQQAWVASQSTLLKMELLLTRPKYVMGLGKEVCKFLLGRDEKIGDIEGRWFDVVWDLRDSSDDEITEDNYYEFKVLPCMHPAVLEYESKAEDVNRIQDTFKILGKALQTGEAKIAQALQEYPVARDIASLRHYMTEMSKPQLLNLVAVDAEWQGRHPQNAGSFIRCVQFCWAPGKAVVVHLSNTNGEPDFTGSSGKRDLAARKEAFDLILQTFAANDLRVAGFFFPADLEWLMYFGLDIRPFYEPAETVEECKVKGGFALELAVAAVDELSRNDLDSVRWRYTSYPPYSHVLANRVKQTVAASKAAAMSVAATEEDEDEYETVTTGYGWIEDEVLYPYAGADVDVTLQATYALIRELDADRFGNNCWLPYFMALGASLTVAEIMQVGMPFDSQQCLELSKPYAELYYRMIDEIRSLLRWPQWNPDSHQQVLEAMYGVRYSTKRENGIRVSVRPPGAMTLGLVPVLSNDSKSPQLWTKIVQAGQTEVNTPGTSGKTIGVICGDPAGVQIRRYNPISRQYQDICVPNVPGLLKIRDIRTLGQLRKTFLGKWEGDRMAQEEAAMVVAKNRKKRVDQQAYSGGLAPQVCDDGYIRAFISQVKETGRWSASRPNLHALPKRREAWYKRIMGSRYPGSVRSMFVAPPGYLILESDYKTAELFMLALASGDERLWQHCQNSLLPSDHADYVDIHSTVAVTGLQLKCPPTPKGLESIGVAYLRDVAKCYCEGEMIGTEAGWLPVEQLVASYLPRGQASAVVAPGRLMLQSDKGKTPLLAVHAAGVKECFAIRSELGYELRVSADHESFVLRDGDVVKVKTKEITPEDHLLLVPRQLEDGQRDFPLPKKLKESVAELAPQLSNLEVAKVLGIFAAVNLCSPVQSQGAMSMVAIPGGRSDRKCELLQMALAGIDGEVFRSKDGEHLVLAGNIGLLLRQTLAASWNSVPMYVFLWSYLCRKAFVEGFLLFMSRGSVRWPVIAADDACLEEERQPALRAVQQLLLSLGMLSRRGTRLLEPYTQQTIDWWCEVLRSGSCSIKHGGHVADRIPAVGNRLCDVGGVEMSRLENLYMPRHATIELLEMARGRSRNREDASHYVDRIHTLLYSQLGFDRVVSVTSIGEHETFDVQTSPDRDHAVVSGGILSSNSIVFGWAYGRQPPAIVIGAKEEGIIIQLEDAEAVVESLFELYPRAAEYLEEASARVQHGFLCTPMGRWRRAPESQDRKTLSAYEREFKNAPIQGGVADVVNLAARRFREVRRETGVKFWIANQVHDAFIFLVPFAHVQQMVQYVIPEAMSRRVPIIPRRLDGSIRSGVEPKFMRSDVSPYFRWGVKPQMEELIGAGIDPAWFK